MLWMSCIESINLFAADTLKDRKQELDILNPKKAYNICEYCWAHRWGAYLNLINSCHFPFSPCPFIDLLPFLHAFQQC